MPLYYRSMIFYTRQAPQVLKELRSTGNFYPVLRQKVLKSWDRIYDVTPSDPNMIVGLAWELRCEWLR